jgi:hypothetical protein
LVFVDERGNEARIKVPLEIDTKDGMAPGTVPEAERGNAAAVPDS